MGYFEVTRKRRRRRPNDGGANGQGDGPTAFAVASENTYLGLVEFLLDLFIFPYPELHQLLGIARVNAYSLT